MHGVGFVFCEAYLGFFITFFFLFSSEYERERANERDIMTACTHIYTFIHNSGQIIHRITYITLLSVNPPIYPSMERKYPVLDAYIDLPFCGFQIVHVTLPLYLRTKFNQHIYKLPSISAICIGIYTELPVYALITIYIYIDI